MIFTRHQARQAAEGRKTQTRRLVLDARRTVGKTKNGSRYETTSRPWTPRVGHREPIKPANATAIGHLVITDFRQEPLGAILEDTPAALADVRAEGHKTRAEFADAWMRQHDTGWPPQVEELCERCEGHAQVDASNQPVPAAGFPCPDCDLGVVMVDATLDPYLALSRFRQRHADTLVWVIEFKPERDTPRLLTPAGRPRGDDIGYTTTGAGAMPHEPEAVDEVTQARLTRQAHERAEETASEERKRKDRELDERTRRACEAAGISESDLRVRARMRATIAAGDRRAA